MPKTDPWSGYFSRMEVKGNTRREDALRKEIRLLKTKADDLLSYHPVVIDGEDRSITILSSDHYDTKLICSQPGEDLRHGALVEWMDQYWIITERDFNSELYTRAKMRQCNYRLRWIPEGTKQIEARWCVVEDGTQYMIGETENRDFVLRVGDSRVAMTIAKDKFTSKLNRSSRFIIDIDESTDPLAYRLSKPFKMGGSYGEDGVFHYILAECNTEDNDNIEERIADYYNVFPRPPADPPPEPPTEGKVWF